MKHTTIELPDDFEKGDCKNCPFSYLLYLAEIEDDVTCCVFGEIYTRCPIKVKETVKVRDIVDEVFGQMQDANEQKQKSVSEFVESLSKPTGVNFYDVIDENGKPKYVDEWKVEKRRVKESEE